MKISTHLDSDLSDLTDSMRIEPQLSALLTANIEADNVRGMLSTLAEAGLSAEHLGGHLSRDIHLRPRGCCRPSPTRLTSPSSSVSFSRVAHLSMLTQSSQVLSFLSVSHPRLLMMLDDSGSGVLHCLAMASVLLRSCASSRRLSAGFETFQTRVFRILSDAECPSSDLGSTSTSLLRSLCLMENSAGLRPIEFSILVGAYSTFHCILNVQGYILTKQVSHGIRVRSTYDLTEYDLMKGDRRDKSPMLMLTLISSDQADPLAESGLLETPVIKKWMHKIYTDMHATAAIKSSIIPVLAGYMSPMTNLFIVVTSLIHFGHYLEIGFGEYVAIVRSHLATVHWNDLNGTAPTLDDTPQLRCSPSDVISFLSNRSHTDNRAVVSVSPIFGITVKRYEIFEEPFLFSILLGSYLLMQAGVIVYRTIVSLRTPRWVPGGRKYLVQSNFYDNAFLMCFICGLVHVASRFLMLAVLNCSDYVVGPEKENFQLQVFSIVTECSAVLFVFLNLFSFFEVYEMVLKHVAFMSICFRWMLAKFAHVLPLLLLWAYLVFGTLFYITDIKGYEFKSQFDVFYSPLRLLGNLASLSPGVSTVALHTLFALVVSINISNMIIAYIINAFKDVASNFDLIFDLSRLNCSLKTWQFYSFLTRLLRFGSKEQPSHYLIRIWELRQPLQRLRSV